MKRLIKGLLPASTWKNLRSFKRARIRRTRRLVEALGYNVARKADYYSPLPTESELERNVARWNRPSALVGVRYDVEAYKRRLGELVRTYRDEFLALPPYASVTTQGFGPGYPEVDAFVLYMMVRAGKPRRYVEVGSGLSTYYCSLAAARNAEEGHPLVIKCVEPYPSAELRTIPGIEVLQCEVQDVDLELFARLEQDDILFIDSSHVLKIDSDIPFLFLEVLPRLSRGVSIHVHDIPFPYNVPHPAEYWVLGRRNEAPYWPMYWNEAMVLQAFLAFNDAFEIELSAPLIRHHDEPFLAATVPGYRPVAEEPNTFSSIWLRKVG